MNAATTSLDFIDRHTDPDLDAPDDDLARREAEAAQAECDWNEFGVWDCSLDAALARERRLDGILDAERDSVADMRRGEW
jgi:hypothetical protein